MISTNNIKTVETVDKFLNCIPIISTIKSVCVGIFLLIHMGDNDIATKVIPSWKNDIKIVFLSYTHGEAVFFPIFLIPIIGNLFSIIHNIRESNKIKNPIPSSELYLEKAACNPPAKSLSGMPHQIEIVRRCLAASPAIAEESLTKILVKCTTEIENEECSKLIFNSRISWKKESLLKILSVSNLEITQYILDKHACELTNEEAGELLILHALNRSALTVKIIRKYYPHIDLEKLYNDPQKTVKKYYPDISLETLPNCDGPWIKNYLSRVLQP